MWYDPPIPDFGENTVVHFATESDPTWGGGFGFAETGETCICAGVNIHIENRDLTPTKTSLRERVFVEVPQVLIQTTERHVIEIRGNALEDWPWVSMWTFNSSTLGRVQVTADRLGNVNVSTHPAEAPAGENRRCYCASVVTPYHRSAVRLEFTLRHWRTVTAANTNTLISNTYFEGIAKPFEFPTGGLHWSQYRVEINSSTGETP